MNNHHLRKHGLSTTRVYSVFWGMNNRCYIETNKEYSRYGGKGITTCGEWKGFDNFLNFYDWAMNNGYKEHLQLDRIDNNKGYSPKNCRWVEPLINCRNQNIRKDNTSGCKGVNQRKDGRWTVRISVNKKRLYIGDYLSLDDAIEARKQAELKYW